MKAMPSWISRASMTWIVVEHQHDAVRDGAEVVEQSGQDCFDRRRGRLQLHERTCTDPGRCRLQRGDQVGPEHRRVVVALVEREPRRGPSIGRSVCQPLRQQRRLAEPGRSRHEGQRRLRPTAQALAQSRTRHQGASQPGDVELGLEQWARHDHLPSGSGFACWRRGIRSGIPLVPRRPTAGLLETITSDSAVGRKLLPGWTSKSDPNCRLERVCRGRPESDRGGRMSLDRGELRCLAVSAAAPCSEYQRRQIRRRQSRHQSAVGWLLAIILATLCVPVAPAAAEPEPVRTSEVTFVGDGGVILHGIVVAPRPTGNVDQLWSCWREREPRPAEFTGCEAFARHGIVTLIYDKRRVGYSLLRRDFVLLAADAVAAVALLLTRGDVDPSRLGLWAQSEGAYVAPLACRRSSAVKFVITVGAVGVVLQRCRPPGATASSSATRA